MCDVLRAERDEWQRRASEAEKSLHDIIQHNRPSAEAVAAAKDNTVRHTSCGCPECIMARELLRLAGETP